MSNFFRLLVALEFLFPDAINSLSYLPPTEDVLLTIPQGLIRGARQLSRNNRTFHAYKRIPYAQPPVNSLRFQAPVAPLPWRGILDGTIDGPVCAQKNYLFKDPKVIGVEDCLYLNVYVPEWVRKVNISKRKLLPVMVMFHWGAFFAGHGNAGYLGPHYLMDRDVIVVTLNYRLGVLGFLSTIDDASPGNYALKDQAAALRWVHDNIIYFGGNKRKVTIFGQSAGGGSVHYHLLSPLTKNMFQGAIAQSGSALALWAKPLNDIQLLIAKQQALLVGCNSVNNTRAMVDCLRTVDVETLLESADSFKFFFTEPLVVFGPVIERQTIENPCPFITEAPIDILKGQRFHDVPLIMGVVSGEGILRAGPFLRLKEVRNKLIENFDSYAPMLMGLQLSAVPEGIPNIWAKISEFFLNNNTVDVNSPKSVQGFIDMYSDRAFNYGTYQSALLHAAKGISPIWFYHFDYRGQYSYGDHFAQTPENINFTWGTSHCDELLYLFSSPQLFPTISRGDPDYEMSRTMVALWTNFAIYGHPTPSNEIHRTNLPSFWKPIQSLENEPVLKNSHLVYFNITGPYHDKPYQLEMGGNFYTDRMNFWASLPLAENVDEIQ